MLKIIWNIYGFILGSWKVIWSQAYSANNRCQRKQGIPWLVLPEAEPSIASGSRPSLNDALPSTLVETNDSNRAAFLILITLRVSATQHPYIDAANVESISDNIVIKVEWITASLKVQDSKPIPTATTIKPLAEKTSLIYSKRRSLPNYRYSKQAQSYLKPQTGLLFKKKLKIYTRTILRSGQTLIKYRRDQLNLLGFH